MCSIIFFFFNFYDISIFVLIRAFKSYRKLDPFVYRNDPKFSDRYDFANSADPDQTAPIGAVWSGSTLFAIPSASFELITLL